MQPAGAAPTPALPARRGLAARPVPPKLAARRRRIRTWRLRATSFALAIFAVAWVGMFGQLATGNDPVLSASAGGQAPPASSTGSSAAAPAGNPSLLSISPTAIPAPPPTLPEPMTATAPAPVPTPLTTSQS